MRNGTQKNLQMELLHCLETNLNTQRKQKNQIFYWKESV
jgi:hypothetical protein